MSSARFTRAERWGLFDPRVENPDFSNIQKRWVALGALTAGAALVISSLVSGSPDQAPTHPTVPTTVSHVGTFEQCMQAARAEILIDPAQGMIAAEACKQAQAQNPMPR